MVPIHVVTALLAVTMGLPVIVEGANGFLYNNDAECTIPFTQASVIEVACQGNYRQAGNTVYQEVTENGCYFGDALMAYGSFVLNQQVNRYFSMTMEVCYYGGSKNAFYKPKRCTSYRRSIDMRNYALMVEEGEESDYQEGYQLKSYWQDEERQEWEEQREQARAYQAEIEQTYLYPGTYSFNLGLSIPQKKYPFENGSELRVKVTLIPRTTYTLPYYRYRTRYRTGISDSKYQTSCYLSFRAIAVYSTNKRMYSYYTAAGVGIFLLGAATYVSSKRRVVCLCDVCADDDESGGNDYQSHVELPMSRSASRKRRNFVIDGEASILTF